MTLTKYNRPAYGNLFSTPFFADFFGGAQPASFRHHAHGFTPRVNVKETDGSFELAFAVPGRKKDDFKIEVIDGTLTVSSTVEAKTEQTDSNKVHRTEFELASFSRSFSLPENVDENGVAATYTDGVLTVTLPKHEVIKPSAKLIEVQ